VLLPFWGVAQVLTVKGKITDASGEPVPFARVIIENSKKGTIANIDGEFSITPDTCNEKLKVICLGYRTRYKQLSCNKNNTIAIVMEEDELSLEDIVVTSDGRDPAYGIIAKTIDKRKFFRSEIKNFQCNTYVKSVQRLDTFPDKFMGVDVVIEEVSDSLKKGIIYLSESQSKLYFEEPENVYEEMISSKVAGKSRSISFNRSYNLLLSFYDNLLLKGMVNERGFVSPVSESAFFYYEYKLAGVNLVNGKKMYVIEVIPKRKNDPVFHGKIHIEDASWRITGADLTIDKDAGLEFVDSIRIQQEYASVLDSVYLPALSKFTFGFGLLGFKASGYIVGSFTEYIVNTSFEKKEFKNTLFKVSSEAINRDTAFWDSIRPLALTEEELKDYRIKDSMEVIRKSDVYRDSIDRIRNKFSVLSTLLTGYTYQNSKKRTELSFNSIPASIQFNTIEGWAILASASYKKRYETRRKLEISPSVRYAFSEEKVRGMCSFSYFANPKKFTKYFFDAGYYLFQYDPSNPITPVLNSFYTLFGNQNYLKAYNKTWVSGAFETALTRGLMVKGSIEVAERSPLFNTTIFSFTQKENKNFTSNNPINPADSLPEFSTHSLQNVKLDFTWQPGRKYILYPDRTLLSDSKWPIISSSVKLTNAGNGIFLDLQASIEKKISFGLAGNSNMIVSLGTFVNPENAYFIDYKHFSGNQTIVYTPGARQFQILPYYTFSSSSSWITMQLHHQFEGFLLNKLPFIKTLKLKEYAGVNLLSNDKTRAYAEFYAGISKWLISVGYVAAFNQDGFYASGFRCGVILGSQ